MGEIARYIFEISILPIKEIAIASALGLVAGICGRAFNVADSGMNLYIMILARTGMGKDSVQAGMDNVLLNAIQDCPEEYREKLGKFIGPSEFTSGPALFNQISNHSQSFVSVLGESGLLFKSFSSKNSSAHDATLRRLMLVVFSKSKHGKIMRARGHASDKDSKKEVKSPAVSFVGESTPETYYPALTPEMLDEGFISRWLIIPHDGYRPDENMVYNPEDKVHSKLPDHLSKLVCSLATSAFEINEADGVMPVRIGLEAKSLFEDLRIKCKNKINEGVRKIKEGEESRVMLQNLYNRGLLKALTVAGVIAAARYDENNQPEVLKEDAQWAINLVKSDIENMHSKFLEGMIGTSQYDPTERNQLIEAERAIMEYLKGISDNKFRAKHRISDKMVEQKYIKFRYMYRKLKRVACFYNDPMQASYAINRVMTVLERRESISTEHLPNQASGFKAKGFWILDVREFEGQTPPV